MKVIVIGSGIAGMAVALRLARRGYNVDVFEGNASYGGKIGTLEMQGFRFDTGPSLFIMPWLLDELLQNEESAIRRYIKPEIACRYFYEDGLAFSAYQDHDKFDDEIQRCFHIDPAIVRRYLQHARKKYELCSPVFIESSLHRLSNYLSRQALKGLLNLRQLDLFSTMDEVNKQAFKDPRLVQYFNRYATYNGSDPYQAPGLLTLVAYPEHETGVYFPVGGMQQLTDSIYEAALKAGVTFHFSSWVNKIIVQDGKARGIFVGEKRFDADIVISNMDIHPTYTRLMPDQPQPARLLSQQQSSSALVFYWGINKTFDQLSLHNVFFSGNDAEEFRHLFKLGTVYPDPTVYVNITSKHKHDDAPPGAENWFVMVNVPCDTGQNWEQLRTEVRKNVLAKLSRMLGQNIEALIVTESWLDPGMIERQTSSYRGALYGNASNSRYAAFLRHSNFHGKIKGLYFCGGSVHPGGGIPLCLQSAKIVEESIEHGA